MSVQQSGGRVHEGRARLVLLELSPEDEHSVPARVRGQLLHVAHRLKPLRTPALRDGDVDLEPVADLRGGRQRWRIGRSNNKAARGVSRWSGGEGRGREGKRSGTHLDVALRRARKRVDDDSEHVREREVYRVRLPPDRFLVLEVYLCIRTRTIGWQADTDNDRHTTSRRVRREAGGSRVRIGSATRCTVWSSSSEAKARGGTDLVVQEGLDERLRGAGRSARLALI